MKKLSLSFLIPTYNDQDTIADVVRQANRAGQKLAGKYEILVINDGSADDTGRVLGTLTKKFPKLSVSTHVVNRGYGQTIKELYQNGKLEWLFSVPGDNQIPVAEIEKLLPHRAHTDMIIGHRVNRQDPPERLRQSRIYNTLLRILFRIDLHDVNSVRLMRREIMGKIGLMTHSAFVDAELAIRARRAGFRIREVPIGHRPRHSDGAGGGKAGTILPVIADIMRFKLGLV